VIPVPTSMFAPTLPNPTITPTPEFSKLPDMGDLAMWVNNYVHEDQGKVTFNGIEIDTSQYPTAKLATDSTLSSSPLGNCDQGIYFYQSRTYSTVDSISEVDKWYRQHGWQDFIIKGSAFGLYTSTNPIMTPIHIETMQNVDFSTKSELTIIDLDLQILVCPD
jgi:hypothetical protein